MNASSPNSTAPDQAQRELHPEEARIHCAFAIDNQYCQHFSAVSASILANSPNSLFHFHVLHGKIEKDNLIRVENFLKHQDNLRFSFNEMSSFSLDKLHVDGHITVASYFRLFLSKVIPEHIKKIIYLDSDMIVVDDLQKLWNFDLSDRPIAAVSDIFMNDSDRLQFPKGYAYFNAGVLLINLSHWRTGNLFEKFISTAIEKNSELMYHDQDVLNILFHREVIYLPYIWNYQARTKKRGEITNIDRRSLSRLRRQSPSIVHFTSNLKPWIYSFDVPFEELYFKYISRTPWRGFSPPDKTWRSTVRRYVRRYAPAVEKSYDWLRQRHGNTTRTPGNP